MAVANYCATLDTGNMFFKLLLPTVVCLFNLAESLEFSQSEWLNPSRPGSSIYIRNDRAKPVRIISVYIRNDGFQNSGEVALNINGGKYFFTAKSSKVGEWSRLIPEKGAKKIPIDAKDSILVTRFEYGKRLHLNRPKKNLVEDYVLDLKILDNSGAYATVKISESSPRYIIGGL